MKTRLLFIALLAISFASPTYAVVLTVDQTTANSTASDSFGDFFYDLYTVTVDTASTIKVTMTPVDAFAGWLGYWDGDLSATPNYFAPPPEDFATSDGTLGAVLDIVLFAQAGIDYQIMVATWDYKPATLGEYNLTVGVPSPASWMILLLGLIALVTVNHIKTKSVSEFVRC